MIEQGNFAAIQDYSTQFWRYLAELCIGILRFRFWNFPCYAEILSPVLVKLFQNSRTEQKSQEIFSNVDARLSLEIEILDVSFEFLK